MKRTLGMSAGALAVALLTACGNPTPITSGSPAPATPFPLQVTSEYTITTASADPTGVSKGADGSVWFTENAANQIGKVTTAAKVIEYPLSVQNAQPFMIVNGPDSNLWFTEPGIGSVGYMSVSGTNQTNITLSNPLAKPWGITVGPDQALWVTDPGSNGIWRITTAGIATFYAIATPNADPTSITTASNGTMWFVEAGTGMIGSITITAGATPGTSTPTLNTPIATTDGVAGGLGVIVTGSDGALYYTETNVDKLGRMTTSGVASPDIPLTGMTKPFGLVAGADGNLYLGDQTASLIAQYNLTSAKVTTYKTITPSAGVYWLTLGADNEVYFSEQTVNKIGQFRYF